MTNVELNLELEKLYVARLAKRMEVFEARYEKALPPHMMFKFYDKNYIFAKTAVKKVRFIKLAHAEYQSPLFSYADMSIMDPRFYKKITRKEVEDGLLHIRQNEFGVRGAGDSSYVEATFDCSKRLEEIFKRGLITNLHVCNERILKEIPDGALVEAEMTFLAVFNLEDELLCWEEDLFAGHWCPAVSISKVNILKQNAFKRPRLNDLVNEFLTWLP
jgi:hypothetical protein